MKMKGMGGRVIATIEMDRATNQTISATSTAAVSLAENSLHSSTNRSNGNGRENGESQAYRQSRKNKHNSIVHMTINAQSLNNKKQELELIVDENRPLIIGVTETWADNSKGDAAFKLTNYVMYRDDRVAGRGGGTMLYISTDLGQRECLALKRPISNQIPFDSSVWCWVTPTKGKKILVGCIYRSTSSSGTNNDKLMK